MSNHRRSIFWFRRDLRLSDNNGLHWACKKSEEVLPIFIFDTNILGKLQNKADSRVSFIWESLQELRFKLNKVQKDLLVLNGKPGQIFPKLIKDFNISSIYCNEDYEPYAISRDSQVKKISQQNNCSFYTFKDQVIHGGRDILKSDGTPYKVFTPYKKKWLDSLTVNDLTNYNSNLKKIIPKKYLPNDNIFELDAIGFKFLQPPLLGGEHEAKKRFKSFLKRIDNYEKERDLIYKDTNSSLSPYLRFGCISIRELLRKVYLLESKGAQSWVSELIWREFYQMILYNFPEVKSKEFIAKHRNILWPGTIANFNKWKNGVTGYPIIDAAMIHFKKTGLMHNRLRMIVASFLVKDLLIDWKKGEQYFAEKLFDFDLASNNGGWQWCASTGCDAQPYFRVFNPVTQSQKFDPHGEFIKKNLPVLKDFPSKYIHFPFASDLKVQIQAKCIIGEHYPLPIVDHKEQRQKAINLYSRHKKNVRSI